MTVPGNKCFPNHPFYGTTCVALPEWVAAQTTRLCLDFVSITFGCQERLYLANVCLVVPIFFSSLVSRKLQGRSCGGKLAPCVLLVEAEPACSESMYGRETRLWRFNALVYHDVILARESRRFDVFLIT